MAIKNVDIKLMDCIDFIFVARLFFLPPGDQPRRPFGVGGRQRWFKLLRIIEGIKRSIPIDPLQNRLKIQRDRGIALPQRNVDCRQPLAERDWIQQQIIFPCDARNDQVVEPLGFRKVLPGDCQI